MIPDPWEALLLGLAAWRTFHLVAFDDILDRPRMALVRLPREWHQGQPLPASYRERLRDFLSCPYCLGAWIAVAWWVAWLLYPTWTLVVSVPFAISSGLVAAQRYLSDST